jgi:hypothetical protein
VSNEKGNMEDWNARKAMLKEKFSKLTQSNTFELAYQQEQLINRLQKRLGKTREAVLRLLSDVNNLSFSLPERQL